MGQSSSVLRAQIPAYPLRGRQGHGQHLPFFLIFFDLQEAVRPKRELHISPSLHISTWALSPERWEGEAAECTRGLQTRRQELNGVESGRELLPGPRSLQQAALTVGGRGPLGWTLAERCRNWAGRASVQEETSPTDEVHKVGHSSHWPLTNTSLGLSRASQCSRHTGGLGRKQKELAMWCISETGGRQRLGTVRSLQAALGAPVCAGDRGRTRRDRRQPHQREPSLVSCSSECLPAWSFNAPSNTVLVALRITFLNDIYIDKDH